MSARVVAPLACLLFLLAAPSAHAQVIEEAAAALEDQSLYVHPDAESALTRAERREVLAAIDESPARPIRIAVLPPSVLAGEGDTIEGTMIDLADIVDDEGIYAVAIPGRGFLAGANSRTLRGVRGAAVEAEEAHGDDIGPMLVSFVEEIGTLNPNDSAAAPASAEERAQGGGSLGVGAIILLVSAALLAGGFVFFSRGRQRARDRSFTEARDDASDDVIALRDDIRVVDSEIDTPGAPAAAVDDHRQAVSAYERAERAWKAAREPADLEPVSTALEEGRWAMASAAARLEGDDPPVRRAPCFFDPRHGPSSRDVEWLPPYGGGARWVPACEADAQRVEADDEPDVKEVVVGGRPTPYWNAGQAYAPFIAGYFGGGAAGLLPPLLAGSVLGMTLGAGPVLPGGESVAKDRGGADWPGGIS